MSLPPRQRRPRPTTTGDPSSSSPSYSKLDKPDRSDDEDARDAKKGLSWFLPLFALGTLRYMSVTSNIIHDCDEVFNYWEPLHYLIYKSGFQTWEYSSQFALRSYLYLLFHELVARPASWVFGEDKVRVFYAVRLFLGIISVITETVLVVALSRRYGKRLASYSLAMLCLSSGCFFASTNKIVSLEEVLKFPFYLAILMGGFLGFLPSSFSMYAVTLSSALFLLGKHALAVSVAAAGVIIGWPFSVLAVLPLTFYCLYKRFKQVFISAAVTSLVILGLSFIIDHYFYKRWTSSVFNLLVYNVVGGGESHLYGTEGPLYYLRNGFNNFNFCFVLALLFLAMLPIAKKKYAPDLLVIVSPIYIWIAFMSLQPHKEESLGPCISLAPRIVDLSTANVEVYGFLHPVYPLICVAAAAVIESFPDLFRDKYDPDHNYFLVMAAKILRPIVLSLILCASHSRTFSLINGYSAPLEIYKHLEHHDDAGPGSVLCVGSEWHRFPSSFFVPDYVGEVRWLDDGFRGLLPIPFNNTMGGTAAAPPYFNNKNKAADVQFLRDVNACTFLIELQLQRPYPTRGSDVSKWEVLAALPYLDRELSPAKYRSFFIPYLWQQKNVFGLYKLLRRIPE